MLKLSGAGEKNGKPIKFVVLGLSYTNLDRLKAGQPIKIDGNELGIPNTEILIFAGKTEQVMARDMEQFIGPQTKINISPRVTDA